MFFKWLAAFNLIGIILPLGYVLLVLVQSWLKPGAGYEYAILGFAAILIPLFYVGVAAALLNAVTIPIYLVHRKPNLRVIVVCLLITTASGLYFGYSAFQTYLSVRKSYEMNRMLTKVETISLINDCQVAHLAEQGGFVHITPREGFTAQTFKDWYYRTAEKGSFNDLKNAADAARSKCGKVDLSIWSNPDPSVITLEQATELITKCDVLVFSYYSDDSKMDSPGLAYTGIIGHNLTRAFSSIPTNLQVPTEAAGVLLPVAKGAQKTCPDLAIRRDSNLEN